MIYIFPSSASLFQEKGGWRQSRIVHPVGGGHPTPGPLGESQMWLPVPFVPSVSCRTRETPPKHLYPLPPSLAPAGNPVPPHKASRRKLKRPREPSPQLFAASRHWAPSLLSRWLFAVRPHHSHPHDSAASFRSTCPSLSISQVTPPPGSHHYPSPLFLTSSRKQPGTPSPPATLAHSLPGFLPQISSLKSSQDF